jgi:flap endonuclease-1
LGVNLTPIIVKRIIKLEDIAGRKISVDANNVLYQFLSLIRTRTTIPLMSPDGTVTSHLAGLLYRTTHLMSKYNMRLVFVFDGKPPILKGTEIEKRRKIREKAAKEWKQALEAGDYVTAFSKAVISNKLSRSMVQDAKKLLDLLGVPYVQAPCEAESQAAYMAMRGDVWASNSRDYDSLLFGTPRLVRYLTIYGREFLPSKGVSRPLRPEIIELQTFLKTLGITREQLIDIAILIGTDFNEGVKGIGPKTSLKMIRKYGGIENLPGEIRAKLTGQYDDIRSLFLKPEVTSDYSIAIRPPKEDEIYAFLCEEKGFSRPRIERAIQRITKLSTKTEQPDLNKWLTHSD